MAARDTPPENQPCAPSPSTDELRARYQFRPEPMRRLTPNDVADLLVYLAAEEMSGGLFRQMTGMDDREQLQTALERAETLCLSYRADEERRFQQSRKSSRNSGSVSGSSSPTGGK